MMPGDICLEDVAISARPSITLERLDSILPLLTSNCRNPAKSDLCIIESDMIL
jgi:hypothetical protein